MHLGCKWFTRWLTYGLANASVIHIHLISAWTVTPMNLDLTPLHIHTGPLMLYLRTPWEACIMKSWMSRVRFRMHCNLAGCKVWDHLPFSQGIFKTIKPWAFCWWWFWCTCIALYILTHVQSHVTTTAIRIWTSHIEFKVLECCFESIATCLLHLPKQAGQGWLL